MKVLYNWPFLVFLQDTMRRPRWRRVSNFGKSSTARNETRCVDVSSTVTLRLRSRKPCSFANSANQWRMDGKQRCGFLAICMYIFSSSKASYTRKLRSRLVLITWLCISYTFILHVYKRNITTRASYRDPHSLVHVLSFGCTCFVW